MRRLFCGLHLGSAVFFQLGPSWYLPNYVVSYLFTNYSYLLSLLVVIKGLSVREQTRQAWSFVSARTSEDWKFILGESPVTCADSVLINKGEWLCDCATTGPAFIRPTRYIVNWQKTFYGKPVRPKITQPSDKVNSSHTETATFRWIVTQKNREHWGKNLLSEKQKQRARNPSHFQVSWWCFLTTC